MSFLASPLFHTQHPAAVPAVGRRRLSPLGGAAPAVFVLALIPGCPQPGPGPAPSPTPVPSPTAPPVTQCAELQAETGFPFCHETDPPMTCGDCLHNPTTDPMHCEVAAPCPTPTPPSGPCPAESALEGVADTSVQMTDEVKKATDTLGDLTGQSPTLNLRKLADQLRRQLGQCVITGGEAVFMLRRDGLWEENHAVYFGTGAWTNSGRGKWMGNHTSGPIPEGGLPDPTLYQTGAVIKLTKHGYLWDSTLTLQGVLVYCQAIGLGEYDGLPRAGCPVRPDGHWARVYWELELLGHQRWWCDGDEIHPGNPFMADCQGHVRTCSEDGTICGEADW